MVFTTTSSSPAPDKMQLQAILNRVEKQKGFVYRKQAAKLGELMRHNLRSVKAYLMRDDFQRFWDYERPSWAGKFLDEWCTRAMRSRIQPMKEMAGTLRRHRALLLNWFRARGEISNGSVEGQNNKAKLALKRAYGFKSYETVEIALYHQLGKLPEPNQTHRFC